MPAPRARFLHVANGTSTTGTIAAAGIPGARSIWADPLYDGPVPAGLNDAELVDLRRQYLTASEDAAPAAWAGNNPAHDSVNDLRMWRRVIADHEAYEELVLWFEHDLFDQLNLIQLLAWIRDQLPVSKPVSLICIGSFPGRAGFKGLGELAPDELASLLDIRRPVTASQFELAQRAWQAFRAPTPEALDALRQQNTAALPYLAAAVTRFLQEYPWMRDGLSRTERRLLQLADGDGITLAKAFPQMHDGEQAYFVTDSSLAELVEALTRTSPPLLTLDLFADEDAQPLRGRIALTETGRQVLTAALDRITTCGIDKWLGGVHLRSGGRVWRWDEARQRIA